MRLLSITITIIAFIATSSFGQTDLENLNSMKLISGITTEKLPETKAFYTKTLSFKVVFENDWFLLMSTPNGQGYISFLEANHPSQQPLFQPLSNGKGKYLTLEVDNVDMMYENLKEKGTEIAITIRDEAWGDRHFSIIDPNGIGIDIVTYSGPEEEDNDR